MDEELAPSRTQLCRYLQCILSPEELLTLSDYFVRHPESRPVPRWTHKRHATGVVWFIPPKLANRRVGYGELVARLEGEVTDLAGSEMLEFRMANDPLSTDYLADLAVFRLEMQLLSGVTHTPLGNRW